MADPLAEARSAFQRGAWRQASEAFFAAQESEPLALDDVERLTASVHLLGHPERGREIMAAAYHRFEGSDPAAAARCAFWIGHDLLFRGSEGEANAWFGRARQQLTAAPAECPEHGLIEAADGIRTMFSGDPAAAEAMLSHAVDLGRRCQDPALIAIGCHGRGRALIAQGRLEEGMAVLDEVMVFAGEGHVPPVLLGDVYCGVLEACHQVFDVRRAREWTAAFTRWCETQPDLVPYRGPCMVYRVELLRLAGAWQDAFQEARKACDWLVDPLSIEGPGDAFYQLAELHRLRGEWPEAESAYREASRHGRPPEPGIALLWLERGHLSAAVAATARALQEAAGDQCRRAELLGSHIEILLAAGDVARAREAVKELDELAGIFRAASLRATGDGLRGRLLIAEGSPSESLPWLRKAWTGWQRLDAPFEAARIRVQIGLACRALGDGDSAEMEFDAARWVFEELGASPELARLDSLALPLGSAPVPGGLTPREVQVLGLIAAGKTNREIALALVISEHTVARHVQNMLAKLAFPSRTRLAAYAIEQGFAAPAATQN